MTKLTTERLETIATWRETYGNGANVMIPAEEAELMARQLLAYEQAAKNPVAWTDNNELKDVNKGYPAYLFALDGEANKYSDPRRKIMLYAAPALPKQPESRNEIMAKGVEAFAKDWKGSARYSRISEMACNFAAKLRNGDADEC